jgi:hypothetical protein
MRLLTALGQDVEVVLKAKHEQALLRIVRTRTPDRLPSARSQEALWGNGWVLL